VKPVALPRQLVQPVVGHPDGGPQHEHAIQQQPIQGPAGGPLGLELIEQPRDVAAGVGDEDGVRVVQAVGDVAGIRGADDP
jgi:hypothetical protein